MTKSLTSLLTSKETIKSLITGNHESTGFSQELLEKDFYITIMLDALSKTDHNLIFKGGTCLNKCYLGYYRLSEDLDFIHADSGARSRSQRKTDFKGVENVFNNLTDKLPGISSSPTEKFDEHQQFRMNLYYESHFTKNAYIKIEVTHRYPVIKPAGVQQVKHQFIHPVSKIPYAKCGSMVCIDLEEAAAEKIRACLTRKEPAIRDFFDLWYIHEKQVIDMSAETFKQLVQLKLDESVSFAPLEKMQLVLEKQVSRELKPTLNKEYPFELHKAIEFALSFKRE